MIKSSLIKRFNFSADCRFILTTYDAICACLGSLNQNNLYNNACEVSGTVTSFRYLSQKKPKSVRGLKISYIPLIKHYIIGLSNNLGGGIIEWYKSFLNKTDYYKKLKNSYNKGNNYFYFFPFIFGDRDLDFRETGRGIFFGLGSNTNIHDMTKGVVDSVCFVSKYLFDRLNLSKKKFNTITLSGGLTRINFINFLKSNLFETKVYTCNNFESTTLGCLILMLMSTTKRKFTDVIKIIKLKEVKKSKKKTADIKSKYSFFKYFIKKNKELFRMHDRTLIKENPHFRNL
jgi:sugar (pentulose or hexulose) kinase